MDNEVEPLEYRVLDDEELDRLWHEGLDAYRAIYQEMADQ